MAFHYDLAIVKYILKLCQICFKIQLINEIKIFERWWSGSMFCIHFPDLPLNQFYEECFNESFKSILWMINYETSRPCRWGQCFLDILNKTAFFVEITFFSKIIFCKRLLRKMTCKKKCRLEFRQPFLALVVKLL